VRPSTIFAHAAIGRIGRPAFPAPSFRKGRDVDGKTSRETRGEIAELCSAVIARSEATKQSVLSLRGKLDRFAVLAMTLLELVRASPLPASGER
jgi:hypothetical protein